MSQTITELSRKDLPSVWNKKVTDVLLHIVNDLGVRHRIIDGGHLLLYPPDASKRPKKVSASRDATEMLGFLKTWIEVECADEQEHWSKVEAERRRQPQEKVSAVSNFSSGAPVSEPVQETVDPEPIEEPEAPETVDEGFSCDLCDFTSDTKASKSGHMKAHSEIYAHDFNGVGRRKVKNAIEVLIEATIGERAMSFGGNGLQEQVNKLTERLAKAEQERDDLKAKVKLMREALAL